MEKQATATTDPDFVWVTLDERGIPSGVDSPLGGCHAVGDAAATHNVKYFREGATKPSP